MCALVGHSGHAMDGRPMPDYNETPAQAFAETARPLVESMGTLSILVVKYNVGIVGGDLLSWVSCFNKPW